MTDINIELFKRYQPKRKLEIIESLTNKELLNVKESTVIRIVKETGTFNYGSKRDKHLNISLGRRKGNDWNSTLDSIDYSRGRISVELYLQYENTDTSIFEYWYRFLQPGEYKGQYGGSDRMGNPRTYYFTYYESDKAKCIKSILLEYVYRKYAEKLN